MNVVSRICDMLARIGGIILVGALFAWIVTDVPWKGGPTNTLILLLGGILFVLVLIYDRLK